MTDQNKGPGLHNLLEMHAKSIPDKPVIIGMERTVTYSQFFQRSQALAKSLYDLGLRPGDQAAAMTYNTPENTEFSHAVSALQAGPVNVGYKMKPPEIEYIVGNSDSRILVFDHEFADLILPYKEKYTNILPNGFISFGGPCPEGALDFETLISDPPDIDLEKLPPAEEPGSAMVYTSGTTGKPKGAARKLELSNREGLLAYFMASIQAFNLKSDEVHIVCCPIYHSAATYFIGINMLLRGTLIYMRKFDAEKFLELIAEHKVTSSFLVPTMITRLLDLPEEVTDKYDLSSLRTILCSAAPLFPDQKLKFLDRFGDILYEFYGSTETGCNMVISPSEIRERPTSVGKALTTNELKIYDDDGNEVPDGQSGVLYMHNTLVMDGYYKNDKATQESYRGKYYTAGDVAVRDEAVYYNIVDRIKDMIIRGGVNIYPAEVEEVLLSMTDIIDAAVVGKKDREFGEIVAAFIVLKNNTTIS